MQVNKIIRIGIVYDGGYFHRISDHYAYDHIRKARISISGLHNFIRNRVAECERYDDGICRIVEAHYFRGRFPADLAAKSDRLLGDRKFEDVLTREGVMQHFLLLAGSEGDDTREKGIDVWLALEAYELVSVKNCDVIVLISGDGDHVPLVRKLIALGSRVMVLAWDVSAENGVRQTRTSQALIDAATYSVEMSPLIDQRERDPLIDALFMTPTIERVTASRPEIGEGIQSGKVINLRQIDKYGFIEPDGGGDNIHFHFSAIVDPDDVAAVAEIGTRVSFVPSWNQRKGLTTAKEVALRK